MSDSENYFSDSDNEVPIEENTNTPKSEEYESSDDEMDEETRRIIFNHARLNKDTESIFLSSSPVVKKSSKKRKKKETKNKSLRDFIEEQERKEEEGKPKKWTSKRFNDKKDKLGLNKEKVVRRKFNPRLPPPNYLTFKKNKDDTQEWNIKEMFPTLGEKTIEKVV